MPLTNTVCQTAKPKEKPYKLTDGGGMYLEVMPNGSKYWRMKYRYLNKEKRLALGVYPTIILAEAREKRDVAKKQLANNIDPSTAKKKAKREAVLNAANTFEAVAKEWHEKQALRWTPGTGTKVMGYLKRDIFPYLGARPIADIDLPELLETLRKIEARGAHFTAGRVKQYCGQIFRYGVATGRNSRDPSADLKGALTTKRTQHFVALDIKDMPGFLAALEKNEARLFPQTRRGLWLLMLTFVRTSELIEATWEDFDLETATWSIPAERMKMGQPHIVPLSWQAVALLLEQKKETEHLSTPWVFPNQVRPQKHMSNNTLLFGIKRLGYQGRMTGHGFRALARTTIRERLRYDSEVIERQLAHRPSGALGAAYDRTQFLEDRTQMMQDWADYLEGLL